MAVPTTKEKRKLDHSHIPSGFQLGQRLSGLDTDGSIASTAGAALTGTTGDSFTLASGESDGKFAISVGTTGTDHTFTLKAPVTSQDVTMTLPDIAADTLVSKTSTDTLTNKTLTTPTLSVPAIGDFTSATHNHSSNATGGLIAASAGTTGTTSNTFDVDSDNTTGVLQLKTTTGGSNHTITLTNATTTAARTVTLPDSTTTLAGLATAQTFTATQTFGGAIAASGTGNFDFSGSSGTFKTSTGAVTIGAGAIAISGAVTFAANKGIAMTAGTGAMDFSNGTGVFKSCTGTNTLSGDVTVAANKDISLAQGTGYIEINAQTSGILKIIPTASTAQTVTLTTAGQTSGAGTITIPDLAGTTDTIMTLGLDQTMTGTLTIDDATTPILTLESGNTNTGYIDLKGKTSGTLRIKPADSTAQTMTFAVAAQTAGASSATIPDLANTADTFDMIGLAQTISAVKTFTAVPIVDVDHANDNDVQDTLTLKRTHLDGNGASGIGGAISMWLDNDAGTEEEHASIHWVSDAADGAEDTDVIFNTMLNGTVTEAGRFDASDQSLTIGQDATDADGLASLRIFPVTASKGSLLVTATANTGDDVLTLTNAAQGQATTVTIPDGGQAAANFVLSEGAATVNGVKTFGSMPIIPSTTKAAAGSVQGDATALATGFNQVTAADGTKGVVLPAAVAGTVVIVVNTAGSVLKLWPNSSDKVNGGAADASINMPATTSCMCVAYDATDWYTIPKTPS